VNRSKVSPGVAKGFVVLIASIVAGVGAGLHAESLGAGLLVWGSMTWLHMFLSLR
jgi:hypothetical protein